RYILVCNGLILGAGVHWRNTVHRHDGRLVTQPLQRGHLGDDHCRQPADGEAVWHEKYFHPSRQSFVGNSTEQSLGRFKGPHGKPYSPTVPLCSSSVPLSILVRFRPRPCTACSRYGSIGAENQGVALRRQARKRDFFTLTAVCGSMGHRIFAVPETRTDNFK